MALPNAWDDGWEADADNKSEDRLQSGSGPPPKKLSTQAERRHKQQEFKDLLWKNGTPNYFLPPLPNADLIKPPPKLLSRKQPVSAPEEASGDVSSDEEGQGKKKAMNKERGDMTGKLEERRLRYEARRLELFGCTGSPATTTTTAAAAAATATATTTAMTEAGSGASSPGETPPASRSATPNWSRGAKGGGRKARGSSRQTSFLSLEPSSLAPGTTGERGLFDPNYTPKPEAAAGTGPNSPRRVIEPIRSPRGPDGSGRGGFGFAPRGRGSGLPADPEN